MLSRYEDRPYLALSLALSKCNCAIETAKQEDIALHQAEKDLLSRLPSSQCKKIASLLPMARLFVDFSASHPPPPPSRHSPSRQTAAIERVDQPDRRRDVLAAR